MKPNPTISRSGMAYQPVGTGRGEIASLLARVRSFIKANFAAGGPFCCHSVVLTWITFDAVDRRKGARWLRHSRYCVALSCGSDSAAQRGDAGAGLAA